MRGVGLTLFLACWSLMGATEPTYDLARRVETALSATYLVTTTIDLGDAKLEFSAKTIEKVESVEPNGTFVVVGETLEGKLKYGTDEYPAPPTKPTRVRRSTSGAVLELLGIETDSEKYRLATLDAFYYPGKPVAVGESWRREGQGNVKQGAPPFRAEYTVDGVEKLGGTETLRIKAKITEIRAEKPAKSEGTYWISLKDGWVQKAELTWSDVPFAGSPGPINAFLKLERL
ncbi:MAG: hypothetical protein KIS66_13085 [Fimbriimonadaceae bacterium]|nr:hypothetical protein [Fimbriimonadaceae bacterium]